MKFDHWPYWKHVRNIDAFFWIAEFVELDHDANLIGNWCVQGNEGWWPIYETTTITIHTDDWMRWRRYRPRGEML